ncbi:MAG: hypothetical protein COA36_14945 [Desulfotalea sp.]|nr:MAG: hypothetical protein COA36_14945 [Desulfotalea sp.]
MSKTIDKTIVIDEIIINESGRLRNGDFRGYGKSNDWSRFLDYITEHIIPKGKEVFPGDDSCCKCCYLLAGKINKKRDGGFKVLIMNRHKACCPRGWAVGPTLAGKRLSLIAGR